MGIDLTFFAKSKINNPWSLGSLSENFLCKDNYYPSLCWVLLHSHRAKIFLQQPRKKPQSRLMLQWHSQLFLPRAPRTQPGTMTSKNSWRFIQFSYQSFWDISFQFLWNSKAVESCHFLRRTAEKTAALGFLGFFLNPLKRWLHHLWMTPCTLAGPVPVFAQRVGVNSLFETSPWLFTSCCFCDMQPR